MMYTRYLEKKIQEKMGKNKAIILIGPRQVGKTTLIKAMLEKTSHLFLNGDDPTIKTILSKPNTQELKEIIGNNTVLFIDEAQNIPNIGTTLKIITDQFKGIQLIVSGSSAFDISNQLNEPLTGRKWQFELLPISWEEYEKKQGYIIGEQELENRLRYGFYPDVLNNPEEEKEILIQLVNSYLYKDILAYAHIRKPEILEKLLQALALQIGSEVSYNELSHLIGIDKNTVEKYIHILQQGYVIFKLNSYSKNLRNELKQSKKIYFYDNGVRNTVLGAFNPLALRQDTGALWENFLIAERVKQNLYKNKFAKLFFWRTKQQQEIDLIEEKEGQLVGYEFKWGEKQGRIPKTFLDTYQATGHIINRQNFRDFVVLP